MVFNLQEEILKYLENHEPVDTMHLASHLKTEHQKIIGAVNSIQALGEFIHTETVCHKNWELTEEGIAVAENGSHEARTYYAVPPEGMPLKILKTVLPDKNLHSIGFNKAMACGWIYVDKSGGVPIIRKKISVIQDDVKEHLNLIRNNKPDEVEENVKQDYKKRKLLAEVIVKSYILRKGNEFSVSVSKQETDLTPDMIASGSWKEKSFKPYNFDALGTPLDCGHLHTLLKVRTEFRRIFLEMGFTEMATNNYIESSFWNFDALFQPQQHPARDAHDTFFVSEPQYTTKFPADYLQRVKNIHSKGGFGSKGYGYDWKIEEAQKNLLRTHTTAVSARMLYNLAQKGFQPAKYFSIDRVFRNETLDATHLAEFQQVEGVVADYKLTLGDLIGILAEFFKKLGMAKLQFKPAYNPYTEPSMEIFSYHEGLGKWMEVGNSGIFRPEMLRPMGLPEDVNVIAWGLSLERPTMIKYGINNIRDLVGPKVNLQMVHDNPICRLGKGNPQPQDFLQDVINRWDSIDSKLQKLKQQVNRLICDDRTKSNGPRMTDVNMPANQKAPGASGLKLKIKCNPKNPMHSLQLLMKLLQKVFTVKLITETNCVTIPPQLQLDFHCSTPVNLNTDIVITIIWKSDVIQPSLMIGTLGTEILGEVNIIRYFIRLLETKGQTVVYESKDVLHACQVDDWLDLFYVHSSQNNSTSLLKDVEKHLSKHDWLVGNSVTAADIYLWSLLKQKNSELNQNSSFHIQNYILKYNNILNM